MNEVLGMEEMLAMIEKHRDEFFRYARRNTSDADTAEDVFSAAVLAALDGREKFTPGSNFRAWMYRIITNKCFVANREKARSRTDLFEAASQFTALYDKPAYIDVLKEPDRFLETCGDEVQAAFRRLSTAERSCILLKGVERFSYKEIAGILKMPVGTVMTHLARGRAKLREDLTSYAISQGFLKPPAAATAAPATANRAVLVGGAA